MESLPLAPGTRALVDAELKPGETERWSSAPGGSAIARRYLAPLLLAPPVAAAGVAFAALLLGFRPEVGNLQSFLAWFLGIPAAAAIAAWRWMRWKAASLGYVITHQRAFVLEPMAFGPPKIRAFATQLGDAALVERLDGSGDVLLGMIEVRGSKNSRIKRLVGFFGLPEPRIPFQFLERLRREVPQDEVSVAPARLSAWNFGGPGFFCALGLAVAGFGVHSMVLGAASRHWPQAQGSILHSYVAVARSSKGGRSYSPAVTYGFTVGGQRYVSSRIEYGAASRGSADAHAIVAYFSAGSAVSVSYDPADPAQSVLVVGIGLSAFLFLTLGLFLLGLAGLLMRTAIDNAWPAAARATV